MTLEELGSIVNFTMKYFIRYSSIEFRLFRLIPDKSIFGNAVQCACSTKRLGTISKTKRALVGFRATFDE